ncbi:MAG TPA: response regulator [Polyangiaceae bacterium]
MQSSPRSVHALLVEDSLLFAEALSALLTEAQADVRLSHVTRLADAERFREAPPDVVLLDLTLPDTEGVDSVRAALVTLPNVPIVVLTADRNAERAIEVVRTGAQDYLVKGAFDADALMRAIRYAVERAQSAELRLRLLQADRLAAIGRLAAGIAHEVSNPAAFVRANQELLRTCLESAALAVETLPPARDSSAFTEALERVRNELFAATRIASETSTGIGRICSVVSDLRAYARLEPGEPAEVRPNDVVRDVCRLASGLVRHKARLVQDLEKVPALALVPGRLDQVLMNLLVNAAHAIREGAPERETIVVSTRVRGSGVLIGVEDSGIGMTEEERRRAFEPLFSKKPRGEGMGLGLSICADIVGAQGGSIRCTSELGKGSRFEVWLPANEIPSPEPCPDAHVPPKSRPTRRARVLLVDDEPNILQTYSILLESEFDIVTAANGAETLARAEADANIDLVICDVMMPDMDAAGVLDEIRRRHPRLVSRFVLHTGGAMTERTRRLVDSGSFPVFFKPISVAEIADAIRTLVANPPGE